MDRIVKNNIVFLLYIAVVFVFIGCNKPDDSSDQCVVTSLIIGSDRIISEDEKNYIFNGDVVKRPYYTAEWTRNRSYSQEVYMVVGELQDSPLAIVELESTGTISGKHKAGDKVKIKITGSFNYNTEMVISYDTKGKITETEYDCRQIFSDFYQLETYSKSVFEIKSPNSGELKSIPEGYVLDRKDSNFIYCTHTVLWPKRKIFHAAIEGRSTFYVHGHEDQRYESLNDLIEHEFRLRFESNIKERIKSWE